MSDASVGQGAVRRASKPGEASTQDELLAAAEEALAWMRGFDRDAPAGLPTFEREAEVRVRLRTAIRGARRELSALCDGCGCRFPRRDLVEVEEDHEILTWFVGDKLCGGCARDHGVS